MIQTVLQEFQTTQSKDKPFWPKGWRNRTLLMAVINITPDSFSDGGFFLDPEIACSRAAACLDFGADILDLGGQSTRPGAQFVGVDV